LVVDMLLVVAAVMLITAASRPITRATTKAAVPTCDDCYNSAVNYATVYYANCINGGGTDATCRPLYNDKFTDYCFSHCSACSICQIHE
jgi:hypothetical protein